MKVWIDPPSGWQYGFPKIWDNTTDMKNFLRQSGYPEKDLKFAMSYMRMWNVKEQDSNANK